MGAGLLRFVGEVRSVRRVSFVVVGVGVSRELLFVARATLDFDSLVASVLDGLSDFERRRIDLGENAMSGCCGRFGRRDANALFRGFLKVSELEGFAVGLGLFDFVDFVARLRIAVSLAVFEASFCWVLRVDFLVSAVVFVGSTLAALAVRRRDIDLAKAFGDCSLVLSRRWDRLAATRVGSVFG